MNPRNRELAAAIRRVGENFLGRAGIRGVGLQRPVGETIAVYQDANAGDLPWLVLQELYREAMPFRCEIIASPASPPTSKSTTLLENALLVADLPLQFTVAEPPPGTLSNFVITEKSKPTRDGVLISYAGIAGNKPKMYGDNVALWDNSFPNPATDTPLSVAHIEYDQQPGAVFLPYLFQTTDYYATFQSGPALTGMCAGLDFSLGAAANAEPPNSIFLHIFKLTTTSVTIRYSTLGGYLPFTFGNWVGIWRGFPNPFRPGKALGASRVPDNSTEGLVVIADVAIDPPFDYTIIYFVGPPANGPAANAGAVLTFTAV